MTRKLASIRRIKDIQPIEGADEIELAFVDGWTVVVRKNEVSVGDLVVYLEIDSWVPHELAPFLSKDREPKLFNGIPGERLKTVKLRGQISQGLILPIVDRVDEDYFITGYYQEDGIGTMVLVKEGDDVTEALHIQKWEPPIPLSLRGEMRGLFPTHLVPKTDQERIQNCFEDLVDCDDDWEVSVKLDGSSITIFRHDDELRVCSRNIELKTTAESNIFVQQANKIGERIPNFIAIQGELMGPGIQGNRERFSEHQLFVYDIFDISQQKYLSSDERLEFCARLGLQHVPIIERSSKMPDSVASALTLADGKSIRAAVREGIVFKSIQNPERSFKAISNKFLLKDKS
jgi:RNA ligase (TIGR02306 family)